MDDLNLPRTEASCPVAKCPWKYDMTNPTIRPDGNRVRLVIPPPAGEHLRPTEIAAGLAARPPKLAVARRVDDFDSLAGLVMGVARDQDEAVVGTHLGDHSTAELAAAFGEDLDRVLAMLAEAGHHPAVSIPMPGGPRLVACWEEDLVGYRCSVCRTTRTSAVDMAEHFTERHVVVTAGIRGLIAGL